MEEEGDDGDDDEEEGVCLSEGAKQEHTLKRLGCALHVKEESG